MKVTIQAFQSLPCELARFYVNKIPATVDDFGTVEDIAKDQAEPYGCGCKVFIRNHVYAQDAMKKYGITLEEFTSICNQLENTFAIGRCNLCT